ncbi:BRO family protein [Flavobacterium sp. DG2-3]|uniref:BRO family protein n=1 Tax=Flavobacterium sp. DG2-3 TaxID=3068317 RepID=UPI00273FF8F5|nr:BRO family protein [Flavobacterium sp. DG2-3]MDP5198334.1 BRO family protein [Flavobacterium sp. DG2-3]
MTKETAIKLFEQKQIRSIWSDEEEKWFFSIVDVVGVLSESENPNNYWKVLKNRLKKEGSQLVTNCNQLKMESKDGKFYKTDVADTEQLFRLIQSMPSKKAEPFKLWLAKIGRERIDEIEDPELGFDRLMETYLKKGYSKEWVNQRLKSIEVRKELTDEWDKRGVKKGEEYAILTDEITRAWSGLSVKEYKNLKNLKKENLRDNMSNLELVLNMLAEATTKEISNEKKPETFVENKKIANQGGTIAGNTRKEIEEKTGKKVVNKLNAINYLENKKELEE